MDYPHPLDGYNNGPIQEDRFSYHTISMAFRLPPSGAFACEYIPRFR